MSIEEKRKRLNDLTQYSQIRRAELLEIIRTDPSYFFQLLTHIGEQKIEQFLDKEQQYASSKKEIDRLREQIQEEEMKHRGAELQRMNVPPTFKRALTSTMCSICLVKHEWKEVHMLPCGHVFHGKCLKQVRKNECPECRTEIPLPGSQNRLHPLMFAHSPQDF